MVVPVINYMSHHSSAREILETRVGNCCFRLHSERLWV